MCERGTVEGALHAAAVAGNIDIGRLLIARGCKVTERDENGRTPLHRAAGVDRVAFGQMLLENVLYLSPS